MIVTETRLPPPLPPPVPPTVPVTVNCAPDVTGPLKALASAVMVVVPAVAAVTSPVLLTVATAGLLEVQLTPAVTSPVVGCLALPNVPVTANCVV